MKFYVTCEELNKLKKSFLNLKVFSIIYIPDVLESFGYTSSTIDEYGAFIVSKKIKSMIRSYSKSKRIRGIIYSNPMLDENVLPTLFETISEYEDINEVALLDEYNVPRVKNLYGYFDEIIFFPSIRKIRIIECEGIKNK